MQVLLNVLWKYLENHPDEIEKLISAAVQAIIAELEKQKQA